MAMSKNKIYLLPLVAAILLCGCQNAGQTASDKPQDSTRKVDPRLKQGFKNNMKDAGDFWDYFNKGRDFLAEKKYQESIEALEKAYEKSFGRAERSVVYEQMAITYEAMGNLGLAANFYEGSAKETMNPEQAAEFNQKAHELRAQLKSQK